MFSDFMMRYKSWFVAGIQALLVLCSLVFAWLLRFDFSLPYRNILLTAAIVLPIIRLGAFSRFNLLHGWWKYTGVNDAWDVAKAILTGTALFWIAVRLLPSARGFPRSVYILEMILSGLLLSGVRLGSRVLAESVRKNESSGKKVILIGAGFAAQMIIREFHHPQSGYQAIGCLDDDATKRKIKIHGVPVLGGVDQLREIIEVKPVDEVLIAVPRPPDGRCAGLWKFAPVRKCISELFRRCGK